VLRLVSDDFPEAIRYRAHIVARAGKFGPAGFPLQLSPAGRARRRGLRAHPVPYAVAAALIILAGSGSAAYAVKHDRTTAGRHPAGVTVTITVPPKAATTSGQITLTPTATPTTLPIAPPYTTEPAVTASSPSPPVSPGTLQVSTTFLRLSNQGYGTFTLTAVGGPVTYSITVPSGLMLSLTSGTINVGQPPQVIMVTASPAAGLERAVIVNPGDISVTIYNTPIS
jgi:hypothetical protein